MRLMFNGKECFGPRGPAGPDGNPIGTVISYMGVSAPKDYLVCDGAVYPVSEYPELAEFFREQFGVVNYFGGDGTADFAVPDMRNLFLRGYHGEAEEPLSGEIGVKQDATVVPYLIVDTGFVGYYGATIYPDNEDAYSSKRDVYYRVLHNAVSSSPTTHPDAYTTRPVNMAVLYCIKAKEDATASSGGGSPEVYSTEETKIGTWIDGKPLYQRVFIVDNLSVTTSWLKLIDASDANIDHVADIRMSFLQSTDGAQKFGEFVIRYFTDGCFYASKITAGTTYVATMWLTTRYTKTTDSEVST